jgi:hypothetical protein
MKAVGIDLKITLGLGRNLAGVNRSNVGEAGEITRIQRENAPQAIRLHDCHEPRIMHLDTANAVFNYETAPVCVDEVVIREKNHPSFNAFNAIIGLDKPKAKTIALNWASADIPKLRDVLQAEVQVGPCGLKELNCRVNRRMLRIARPIDPK